MTQISETPVEVDDVTVVFVDSAQPSTEVPPLVGRSRSLRLLCDEWAALIYAKFTGPDWEAYGLMRYGHIETFAQHAGFPDGIPRRTTGP